MKFELSIWIDRLPEEAFVFLRDKHLYPQPSDSPVSRLDKVTPGPVGVGTRFVEVVRGLRGEIHSEITCFEPASRLEEDFWGAGMTGHLAYRFLPEGGGMCLIQRESIRWHGITRLVAPILRWMLDRKLRARLAAIKADLEAAP